MGTELFITIKNSRYSGQDNYIFKIIANGVLILISISI